MRYLKLNTYNDIPRGGEQSEVIWDEQYREFLKEFELVIPRLPKTFIKEFKKHHLHDSIINHILIQKINLKRSFRYNFLIEMRDYYNKSTKHTLEFTNVDNIRSNMMFDFAGVCDWLFCEILPVNGKRLSFEVMLFDNSFIYFEFSKLKYRKSSFV